MNELTLQKTTLADLEAFFEFQNDPIAANMAAFVPENWDDKDAYIAKWTTNLANPDPDIACYTIYVGGNIAGSVFSYKLFGELQASYWIGRQFWNQGIATKALQTFLQLQPLRPIYGRVAFDNAGSIRVLTKCGFRQTGTDKYHSGYRKQEIGEVIFVLEN